MMLYVEWCDLGCKQVGLKSFVVSIDYRDYMGSSSKIWALRCLFLYLCSYNLVGSVTRAGSRTWPPQGHAWWMGGPPARGEVDAPRPRVLDPPVHRSLSSGPSTPHALPHPSHSQHRSLEALVEKRGRCPAALVDARGRAWTEHLKPKESIFAWLEGRERKFWGRHFPSPQCCFIAARYHRWCVRAASVDSLPSPPFPGSSMVWYHFHGCRMQTYNCINNHMILRSW
jgi:hypothetical protein